MRRSIVVGIDGSAEAASAAAVAASLARAVDRRLVLAHVADDPPVFPFGDTRLRTLQRRRALRRGTELLQAAATDIGEGAARKRVVLSGLPHGTLEERLAELSREEAADLLVVGSRSRGRLTRALLGSVSDTITSSSVCPVLVVPAPAGDHAADSWSGPIVCGIDGSAESERARVVAEELADRLGLRLLPIYVDNAGPWSDAPHDLHVEVGEPAAALARAASREGATVIAVGTRGRGGLLGSVARDLVARAAAPVLIVPPKARLPRFPATPAVALPRAA